MCMEVKNLTFFLLHGTMGHLNSSWVPTVRHLPILFQKMQMPRGLPKDGGGRGHGVYSGTN